MMDWVKDRFCFTREKREIWENDWVSVRLRRFDARGVGREGSFPGILEEVGEFASRVRIPLFWNNSYWIPNDLLAFERKKRDINSKRERMA